MQKSAVFGLPFFTSLCVYSVLCPVSLWVVSFVLVSFVLVCLPFRSIL